MIDAFGPAGTLAGLISVLSLTSGMPAQADTAPSPRPPAAESAPRPAYWRDARLGRIVAFPLERHAGSIEDGFVLRVRTRSRVAEPIGARPSRVVCGRMVVATDFAAAVKEKTGVTVLFAGLRAHELLALPAVGGPVNHLMDQIAESYHARWFLAGKDNWVLAGSPNEVRLALQKSDARWAGIGADVQSLAKSLSAAQWATLSKGDALSLSDLSPAQRSVMLEIVQVSAFDPELDIPPTASGLAGQNLMVQLTGSGREARLQISEGGWNGNGWRFFTTFWDPSKNAWTFGFPPPR